MRKKFCKISLLCLSILTAGIEQGYCNKVFPISTEFQIGKIKHMVEQAPPGVYVSVGSERSFRGASMAPNVTHVYLLDVSPEILRFNQINGQLLKAPDRQAYLHLRWKGTYDEWKKLTPALKREDFDWWNTNIRNLETMGYPLPEALNKHKGLPAAQKFLNMRNKLISFYQAWKSKESPSLPEKIFIESATFNQIKDVGIKLKISLTITQEEWDWWTAYGRNKKLDCPKIWLENPEQAVDLGEVVDYKTGNYLFDDKLYARLHHLALHNGFTNLKIDLSDDTQFDKFLSFLKKEKATISVLDLDNLYFKDYIGEAKYTEIVKRFLPFGQDASLLMVMSNYKEYACGQFQIYLGFTFSNIQEWPSYFLMQTFFDTLPKPLCDLIDGRVYEKGEHPPFHYLLGKS